jgi:MFS family permease
MTRSWSGNSHAAVGNESGMSPEDRVRAAEGTLRSLSWLNFTVAAMQAGFGPFVTVRLTASGWNPGQIGIVLTAASIASVAAQVPSGFVIDQLGARRALAATAIVASVVALLMFDIAPLFPLVLAAEVIQGASGVGLSLAITAITLSLSRQKHFGERLGRNVRYAAGGVVLGTAGLGLAGNWIGPNAVFLMAALFGVPALLALAGIRKEDLETGHLRSGHHTAAPPWHRRSPPVKLAALLRNRALLALLACVALFQLGNASLLPLAATKFAHEAAKRADLVSAAAVIGPQLLAALISPKIGRAAQDHGRRIVLLFGLAAVPLRAAAFAIDGRIPVMLFVQLLDGIGAAVIGVMIPLIVADITHHGGRFNFTLGLTGLAGYLGAMVSTSASGAIANAAGLTAAFLALTVCGLAAILVAGTLLPETKHLPAKVPALANSSVGR